LIKIETFDDFNFNPNHQKSQTDTSPWVEERKGFGLF
jgi:hypothetical protein